MSASTLPTSDDNPTANWPDPLYLSRRRGQATTDKPNSIIYPNIDIDTFKFLHCFYITQGTDQGLHRESVNYYPTQAAARHAITAQDTKWTPWQPWDLFPKQPSVTRS
jgi:hypothetical protein